MVRVPAPRRPVSPAAPGRGTARPTAGGTRSGPAQPDGRPQSPAPERGARDSGRVSTPKSGVPRVGAPPAGSRPSSASTPRAAARPASSRPGSRPTGQRVAGAAQKVQVRLPRLFTVRVMVFASVLLLAFILVSPTLHSYLQQRQQLADLRAQVAAAKAHNDDLHADLKRWDDPAYVQAQARQRLSFVMPGEKAFQVADPQTVPDVAPGDKQGPSAALDDTAAMPWYQGIWQSVRTAGEEPVATPSTSPTTGSSTAPATRSSTAPTDAPGAGATPKH
jgi:cell division protein FtsB